MELTALTDGTSSTPAAATAAAIVPAGAPRHAGPVLLSFAAGNYSKWCIYMRASLGRSGYLGHVDGTVAAAPTDAAWATADYTVLNHLHAAIDEDVADMILAGNQTARQLWLAARDLFTANKANKAIYLDNDFRQLVQGSLSIHEYCRRQKHLADALFDNDSPVSDRALVLNTLRGLGPRFASAATVISMTDPLPTFLRTRAMLLMEEMQQANAAATSANTALVAQARGPASSCPGPGCRGDGPAPGAGAGKGKQPAKQKGRTGGRQGGGATQGTQPARAPAPTGPWVCFSPGAGQWRAPSSGQGILGPRPQAYTATAPSTSATTWDSSALIAALNNLALQQGGWVMDSGASSHMTNDDGNLTRSSHLRTPHFVTVGDGTTIPITSSGFISFRTPSGHVFRLNHFGVTIRSLQTDNGTEFLNKTVDTLLTTHGTALRLSCPYTSQQNACSFVIRACAYGAARTRRPLRHADRATTARPCARPECTRPDRERPCLAAASTGRAARCPAGQTGPVMPALCRSNRDVVETRLWPISRMTQGIKGKRGGGEGH
ncbi:hypothetical protein QYE76_063261 [Lolium multiflorum]|uniref:Retrovirus-related Pol polyprotein from transposon TNT 1-94-like beta-barrel domain-containing protein n=1 Tax=Lolium multiflorum TaxID=4521 RepID=A0AAD8S485_LOLMU|nr:hypothetical protein QYE76_063261 [Lolium multiflorum]